MTVESAFRVYPVFPLQAVCFPGHRLPLRVFEPRYLQMLADIAHDPCFVIALIRSGPEVGGDALPFPVGTLVDVNGIGGEGAVKRIEPLGRERMHIGKAIREGKPYLCAECRPYVDEDWESTADAKLKELEAVLVEAAAKHAPGTEDGVEAAFARARGSLDDENFSLFLCGCLALPLSFRQRMLQMQDPVARMEQALHLLRKAGSGESHDDDRQSEPRP